MVCEAVIFSVPAAQAAPTLTLSLTPTSYQTIALEINDAMH
jgi:hypothetical protein